VTIEFKTFCQSELACPELVEGKPDERMLEILRMFVRHPLTKLRMTIGLKISVSLSLSKTDEKNA